MTQRILSITEKNKLNYLLNRLDYIKKNLEYSTKQNESFLEKVKIFREEISSFDDDNIIELFFSSQFTTLFCPYLKYINDFYMKNIETNEAFKIIKNNGKKEFYEYINDSHIKSRFDKKWQDFNNINIKDHKNILMIGSGALPETLFYLDQTQKFNNIVGIDDNTSVFIAKETMKNIKTNNEINFIYTNFKNFDYKGFDLIYIPAIVNNKEEILNMLEDKTNDNVTIVTETPKFLNKIFFEEINEITNSRYKITRKTYRKNIFSREEILTLSKYKF